MSGSSTGPTARSRPRAALPLPDGGTLLTYVDVSDSKRVERALIERTEALEAARPAQDRLRRSRLLRAAHAAHQSSSASAELLASPLAGPLTDKQREYLNDISRCRDGHCSPSSTTFSISPPSMQAPSSSISRRSKCADVIEHGGERRARAAEAERHEPRHRDRARHRSSSSPMAARVTQILYNLLSNAIGFSPAGGRIALDCGRENSMVALSVEDQGVGIPEDYQQTRVRSVREPTARLAPSRHWPRPVHRQEPRRAARRHGVADFGAGTRARASRCCCRSSRSRRRGAEPRRRGRYKSSRAG